MCDSTLHSRIDVPDDVDERLLNFVDVLTSASGAASGASAGIFSGLVPYCSCLASWGTENIGLTGEKLKCN